MLGPSRATPVSRAAAQLVLQAYTGAAGLGEAARTHDRGRTPARLASMSAWTLDTAGDAEHRKSNGPRPATPRPRWRTPARFRVGVARIDPDDRAREPAQRRTMTAPSFEESREAPMTATPPGRTRPSPSSNR